MNDSPQAVTYSDTTKELTLHFENPSLNQTLSLSTGIELTIYKANDILKGELKVADPKHFANALVSSEIQFQNIDSVGDLRGGITATTTKLQLKNSDTPYITIAEANRFILCIIGVDDIRALVSIDNKYNYKQTYIMEDQRIFLKTSTSGNNTTLEIKYIKR